MDWCWFVGWFGFIKGCRIRIFIWEVRSYRYRVFWRGSISFLNCYMSVFSFVYLRKELLVEWGF